METTQKIIPNSDICHWCETDTEIKDLQSVPKQPDEWKCTLHKLEDGRLEFYIPLGVVTQSAIPHVFQRIGAFRRAIAEVLMDLETKQIQYEETRQCIRITCPNTLEWLEKIRIILEGYPTLPPEQTQKIIASIRAIRKGLYDKLF